MAGICPIPLDSIFRYADEYDLEGPHREAFINIILDVDAFEVKQYNEREQAKKK